MKAIIKSRGRSLAPSRAVALTFLVVALGNVAIGLLWISCHLMTMPRYGDSNEYIRLSHNFNTVDEYRTILYPAILHVVQRLGGNDFLPVIYGFQLLLSFTSIYFFLSTVSARLGILNNADLHGVRERIKVLLFATVMVFANPLLAHLNMSVMTDSLATSFTLLLIACLLSLSDLNGGGGTCRARLMIVTLAVFILMSLSRVEKLYLATFLFAICLGSLALGRWRQHGRIEPRPMIALCLVLICGTGSVIAVKKLTTTAYYGRPPLNLSNIAFNRVVWPHLAAVYPKLPDDANRILSFEEAVWFDSHANNVYPLLSWLLSQGSDGKHVVNEITRTTLRVMPVTVVGRTFWDFIKYTISPITFPLELVNVLKQSTATAWTLSRMTMFHPTLTWLTVLLTYGAFFLLGLPLAVLAVARTSCNDLRRSLPALFIVMAAILGNAGLFALFAGMDAHIRYALPSYTMLVALAGLANLVWVRKLIQAGV